MSLIFEEESHLRQRLDFDGQCIELRGYLHVGKDCKPHIYNDGDVVQLFRKYITFSHKSIYSGQDKTQMKKKAIVEMLREMERASLYGGYTTKGVKCIEVHEKGKKVTLGPSDLMKIST